MLIKQIQKSEKKWLKKSEIECLLKDQDYDKKTNYNFWKKKTKF